jgi:hypothetical protein
MVKQGGEIEPVKVHGTGVVQNPHDRDAQWSAKGKQKKDWVDYKVQVAETVASDQSSFISSVVTQRATESDAAGLPATLQKQQALGFEPRRSSTSTELTFQGERSTKPKKRHFLRSVLTMGIAARRCLKPHQPGAILLIFLRSFRHDSSART